MLLADVQRVQDVILLRHISGELTVADMMWHIIVVIYFGSGGQGLRTYEYFARKGTFFEGMCPPEAQMPILQESIADSIIYIYIYGWKHATLNP